MIKEYLGLIKVGGGLLLAAFLVVGGCKYGENTKTEEISSLSGQVVSLQAANNRFAEIDLLQKEEIKVAQQKAKEWMDSAKAAGDRTSKAEENRRKAERDVREALARAAKDPTCVELQRMQVCEAIPMP